MKAYANRTRAMILYANETGKSLGFDKQLKVKDTALDFTVRTSGADLRFLALQPGIAMGGWGPAILCFSHTLPVYLPQISPGTHLELGRL